MHSIKPKNMSNVGSWELLSFIGRNVHGQADVRFCSCYVLSHLLFSEMFRIISLCVCGSLDFYLDCFVTSRMSREAPLGGVLVGRPPLGGFTIEQAK